MIVQVHFPGAFLCKTDRESVVAVGWKPPQCRGIRAVVGVGVGGGGDDGGVFTDTCLCLGHCSPLLCVAEGNSCWGFSVVQPQLSLPG